MNASRSRQMPCAAQRRLSCLRGRGRGSRGVVAAVAAVAMLLLAAPVAVADYAVDRFIGEGLFGIPSGVAVDQDSGQVFMVDRDKNRVLRLDADGEVEAVWGRGVSSGGTAAEVCMAPAPCRDGTRGEAEGMFAAPSYVAVSQATGRVYVFDRVNRRVQEFSFDDGGTPGNAGDDVPVFVRAWGWGVADGGEEFQICTSGCRAGIGGDGVGQFSSGGQPSGNGIAVSPVDGDVFVSDTASARILRFDADGMPAGEPVIGGSGRFDGNRPLALAIDSQGILYAADTQGSGEIERYDSAAVHGPAGFLAPISVPPLLAATSTAPAYRQRSTGGLAVDRVDDGAGSMVDRLLVYRLPSDGSGLGSAVVQAFDEPGEPVPPDVDAGPFAADIFGSEGSRGIGINEVTDRLYVTNRSDGGDAGPGLYVLDADGTAADVGVSVPAGTDVGPHGATFEAQIDPMDGRAQYWFEYARADESDWTASPLRAASGSGPQAVSEVVSGLQANSEYRVRLQARKVLGPDASSWASATSGEGQVQTVAIAPTVATGRLHSFSDSDAWLTAEINAEGSETSYFFEYGTDASYGQVTAVRDAGDAGTVRRFLERVEGLEANTTYHYRVVAENPEGVSVGADRTFTTRPTTPFAVRAFEQVSPVDKLDIDIMDTLRWGGVGPSDAHPVSADGDAAAFRAWQALEAQDWGGHPDQGDYVARRSGSGWETVAARPRPADTFDINYKALSLGWPDLDRVLWWSISALEQPPVDGVMHVHDTVSGEVQTIGVSGTGTPQPLTSADVGNVAFRHKDVLVSEAGIPGPDTYKVYEYLAESGEIRLVSRRPGSDAPFAGDTRVAGEESPARVLSAVSADGQHVFFEATGSGGASELYRRTGGSETALVSGSQRSPADPQGAKDKRFLGATADGGRVFFSSSEELVDGANTGQDRGGTELYRYDFGSGELVAVSAESNTADGARVQGILGLSDGGDVVYYVALGQVVAGQGTPGGRNVYRWADDGTAGGQTRFVATLDDSGSCHNELTVRDSCVYSDSEHVRTARVSGDGGVAAFQSTASLTGYPTGGHPQIYVYEHDAHGGSGGLSCVSCRPSGEPSQGAGTFPRSVPLAGNRLSPVMSTDGRRVFFNSTDRVVAGDVNDRSDVYEWQAGRVRLISTGQSVSDATFAGADPAGDSVFFRTRSRLVGQDVDGLLDVYVARVGGGIAAQWPADPGEPCSGEGCKPPPPPPPGISAPATPGFSGAGNVVEPRDCRPLALGARRAVKRFERVRAGARRATGRFKRARRAAARAPNVGRGRARRVVRLRRRAVVLRKRTVAMRKRAIKANRRARACRRAVDREQGR